jgi:hypothetical protein
MHVAPHGRQSEHGRNLRRQGFLTFGPYFKLPYP